MPLSDERLLQEAERRRDAAALVRLYTEAGDTFEGKGELDAACFFLTQAYVWALEMGHPGAAALHRRLVAHGREE